MRINVFCFLVKNNLYRLFNYQVVYLLSRLHCAGLLHITWWHRASIFSILWLVSCTFLSLDWLPAFYPLHFQCMKNLSIPVIWGFCFFCFAGATSSGVSSSFLSQLLSFMSISSPELSSLSSNHIVICELKS